MALIGRFPIPFPGFLDVLLVRKLQAEVELRIGQPRALAALT
jgi:hypothetical protein